MAHKYFLVKKVKYHQLCIGFLKGPKIWDGGNGKNWIMIELNSICVTKF
jgi:hypothetical protein